MTVNTKTVKHAAEPMTALDAAYEVLKNAGEPLHYKEITKRILAEKLWETAGKTPWETVNARLAVHILEEKETSRFERVGPGIFTLAGKPGPVASGAGKPAQAASSPKHLSFTDAAEQVLERFGKKKPMHYRDLTKHALDAGWLETLGKTPEATMYSVLLVEVQRHTRRGSTPRFVLHGKGYVGLARWQAQGLGFQIENHNEKVRKALHERIRQLAPTDFEALVGQLLGAIGFADVEVTPASGDGGIDVRGTLVVADVIRTRMAVQVKRWKQNVQAPVVQQVRGSLGTHEQGLIITTSDFSPGARTEAARANAVPVALMAGDEFVDLLIEHDIGIKRVTYDLFELGAEDDDGADEAE